MRITRVGLILLVFTLPIYAATNTRSALNALNHTIATVQVDLHQATLKKSALQNALAHTEITEGHLNEQLKKTQSALIKQQEKLARLQQQSIPLSQAKNKNHALLKQQIRAAYLLSLQPYFKMVLSPNSTVQARRTLMDFHYITTAQLATMHQLQQSLLACENNQRAIARQHAKLLITKSAQLKNQQALKKTGQQRQQLIQAISQRIQTKHQKLTALLHNKQRLEKTIDALNAQTKAAVFSKTSKVPNLPFARLRNQLSWPTAGTIRHAFGTPIYHSELTWDGVLITAKKGQAVHAVAAGRVIFAKWMAGYGLLLIINQGNGYMTLYGRNQTLTQKTGDWVTANQVIGSVGKSGGFTHPGLYFSIRYNGKAVNPNAWCH